MERAAVTPVMHRGPFVTRDIWRETKKLGSEYDRVLGARRVNVITKSVVTATRRANSGSLTPAGLRIVRNPGLLSRLLSMSRRFAKIDSPPVHFFPSLILRRSDRTWLARSRFYQRASTICR